MKYIKKFNEDRERSIEDWCIYLKLNKYNINKDNIVDVNDNVYINMMVTKIIPIQFGVVNGCFKCCYNVLTSLKGSPKKVGTDFQCNNNNLTTLKGGPIEVGEDFFCANNKLKTLKWGPIKVGEDYGCYRNKLISLENSPKYIGRRFSCDFNELINLIGGPNESVDDYTCSHNKLTSLEGGPKIVGGDFLFMNNPIFNLYVLFVKMDDFENSLDYNYLRGDKIIKLRFEEACDEAGIKVPESITGYKYI